MATRIQLRAGTTAEWQASNPILSAGEPGVELPFGYLKIGNGTTAWNQLAYVADPDSGGDGDTSSSGTILYQAATGGAYLESTGRIYIGVDPPQGVPENSLLFRRVT